VRFNNIERPPFAGMSYEFIGDKEYHQYCLRPSQSAADSVLNPAMNRKKKTTTMFLQRRRLNFRTALVFFAARALPGR